MWERAAEIEWWLKEYGITPDQRRALPAWAVARIPQIAATRNEVIAEKQRSS